MDPSLVSDLTPLPTLPGRNPLVADLQPITTQPGQPRGAVGPLESFQAGIQGSVAGLAWRQKIPDLVMSPDTQSWWERAITGVTQVAADLPIMYASGVIGGAKGAALGAAISGPAAPAGAAVGGILVGGAAMFGVVGGIRESLMQAYRARDAETPADWFNIVRDVAKAIVHESAVGAVTMGTGALARGGAAAAMGAGTDVAKAVGLGTATMASRGAARAGGAADVAGQIAGMVTMPAALDGRLPGAQEFADAAVVILTLKAGHVALDRSGLLRTKKMVEDTYVKTGKTPAEQVADAKADPRIAEDFVGPPRPDAQTPERWPDPIKVQEQLFTEVARRRDLEGAVPVVTPEATSLIREADRGNAPAGMTEDLRRIATDNGIEVTDATTPKTVVDAIREKMSDQDTLISRMTGEQALEHARLTAKIAALQADLTRLKAFETSTERVRKSVMDAMANIDEARLRNDLQSLTGREPDALRTEQYASDIAELMVKRIVQRAQRLGKTPDQVYGEYVRLKSGFWMPDARLDEPAHRASLAEAAKARRASMPPAPGKIATLIGDLKALGGIDRSYLEDTVGDTKTPKGIPADLFHKNGQSLDDLVTRLNEAPYFWNIDIDTPDGGIKQLQQMIRTEASNPGTHYRQGDEALIGARNERDRATYEIQAINKALKGEKTTEQEEQIIREYLDEHDAMAKLGPEGYGSAKAAVGAERELTPGAKDVLDTDAVERAVAIDPDAVERAATRFDGDDVGFMAEIRRILGEPSASIVEGSEAAARAAAAEAEAGAARAAIERDGTQELRTALASGELTPDAALAISAAAPGNEALQAIGRRVVSEGNSTLFAVNLMKAVDLVKGERPELDDAGRTEAETLAGAATRKQMAISEEFARAQAESRAGDSTATWRAVDLDTERRKWDKWQGDPALVESLRELKQGPARAESARDWKDAPINEADYVTWDEISRLEHAPYVKDGLVIANSRQVPNDQTFPAVGTWRISTIKGIHGREIEQLVELPIASLKLGELDRQGRLDPTKAGDDARYAEWLKEGRRAPPITVLQQEAGTLSVMDGHRRALAAQRAGQQTIEAWVNYAVPIPDGGRINSDPTKPFIRTGMTYEMLTGEIQNPYLDRLPFSMSFDLKPETPAELQARNNEAVAQAKRKLLEERNAERAAKGLAPTVDQADLFNTQGTLFQGVAELRNGEYVVGDESALLVSQARRTGGDKGPPEPQRDLFTETEVSRKARPQPAITVGLAKRGELRIGFDGIINTPERAASAFAALRKSPREYFEIIVTGADDKPIAAYHLFEGTVTQTSVYPREVLTAVYMTPGAAKVWFAHNHPSGFPEPSPADLNLTKALAEGLGKNVGVEFAGHVIIAGNKAKAFDNVTNSFQDVTFAIPPTARRQSVPIMERVIKRQSFEDRPFLLSPESVREYIKSIDEKETGLILLDAQNRPLGFWPIGVPEMSRLRTGDTTTGAARVMEMVGRLNPAGAIAYIPEIGNAPRLAIRNIGALLNIVDVRMVDAMAGDPNIGKMTSYAETGQLESGGTFYQSAPRQDWYYSELARQIETHKQGSAPAAQWKGLIKNLKGVKADEIEASQVNEWLDTIADQARMDKERARAFVTATITRNFKNEFSIVDDKAGSLSSVSFKTKEEAEAVLAEHKSRQPTSDKVTREQVLDYIKRGGLRVQDVLLGGDRADVLKDPAIAADVDVLAREGWRIERNEDDPDFFAFKDPKTGDLLTPDEILKFAETEPELLPIAEAAQRIEGRWDGRLKEGMTPESIRPAQFAQWQLPGGKNYREAFITLPERPGGAAKPEPITELPAGYKAVNMPSIRGGTEWGVGPSAHPDRWIAGGFPTEKEAVDNALKIFNNKALSDWNVDKGKADWSDGHGPYDDIKNPIMRYRFNERTDAEGKRTMFLEELQPPTKAEFAKMPEYLQKNWLPMGLKRVMVWAAQNGFDKVSWTTGAQQVERYTNALRKNVDAIEWEKTPEGVQLVGYKGTISMVTIPNNIRLAAENAVRNNDMLGFDTMGEAMQAIVQHRGDWHNRWDVQDQHDQQFINRYIEKLTEGRKTRNKVVDTRYAENELTDALGKAMADRIRNDPGQKGVIEGENLRIDETGMYGLYDRMVPATVNRVLKDLKVGGKVEEIQIGEPFTAEKKADPYTQQHAGSGYPGEQQGFSITPELRDKANAGLPLFQKVREEHRAAYSKAEKTVTLFKTADRSSIIHEVMGHDWLEELKQDAERPDAPAQIKADWTTLRMEFAIPEKGPIPTTSHEQHAKTMERYFAEGYAPSLALKSIFERFKVWMLDIYKSVEKILGNEINPAVRAVYDRMLASDEEIAAARELGVPRAYVGEAKAAEARKIVPGEAARRAAENPFTDELPPGPGEAPDNIHVNYAYINSQMDVKLAMQRMAEIDQDNIQKQRGGREGVKSWEEANAEQAKYVNDILGGGEDTLRIMSQRDPDAAGPDVKLGILKKLAVGAAKDSARLRDIIIEKGHDATVREQLDYMGSIERARMIQAEFLGERAGVARALNALKDTTEGTGEIAKMLEVIGVGDNTMFQSARTPAQEQAYLKAKLDEILQNYRGKSVLDIARLHREIGTLKGSFKFSKSVTQATKWEMVVEGWKAGLLSGVVTHTTNLFGTGAFQSLRPAVDALASVIGMARGASVGMGEGDRASMSEAVGRITGMLGGIQDAMKVGYHTFRADQATGKTESYREAIPGRAGQIIRIPLRLMGAEDAIVTTMYRRGELKTLAIRQAFDENMNPGTREFAERVDALMDAPPEAMALAADAAATRMSFNAPLGEKGVSLQMFVNKWNLQWMIPFIRTPIDIAKEFARMSPFAPLVGEWRADIAKGGVARDRALAEIALGSGIMALTMSYAFSGNVSGGGSPDPGKNRGKAGVWQPYSILIDGKWYEYARIQPTGTLMGMAADIADVWDHMTEEEKDKVPKMLARAFANSVTNQTFLQGITNVLNAMSDPTRFGPRFFQQMAGSLVPNIVGQPTAMADPYVREVNSALEAIQARVPGMREQLIPKRDWLGKPVETKERPLGVMPVRVLPVTEDKVRLEAARLDISMAAAPKKTHIGKGTGKLGDVELTPEERDTFERVGGEMAQKILTNIVNAAGYDQIPDMVKRKIFARVLTASHQVAAVAALPMDKRIAYIQSISEKVAAALEPENP